MNTVFKLSQRRSVQPFYKMYASTLSRDPTRYRADGKDMLYRTVQLELRGHDPEVLNSYSAVLTESAKFLDIGVGNIETPPHHHFRKTLSKSPFIFKRAKTQYEIRTYFKIIDFHKLTGSTADTYLEYVQRNLPEGVAMKVTRHAIEQLPEHLCKPPENVNNVDGTN